jgi:Ca2+-binding RTX toxin-like protein
LAVINGNNSNNSLTGTTDPDTISGNGGNDTLFGGGGTDTLFGGSGTDTLDGGTGADSLNGGSGTDTVTYTGSGSGVTVNLTSGTGSGGDAQGDTIAEVENITGSNFDDVLTGNTASNTLTGGTGHDSLYGGDGADTLFGGDGNDLIAGGVGADSLSGGAGDDTLDYSTSTAGVTINLGTNTASGGDAASDTITGFENVIGSGAADNLTGTNGNNTLVGGGGNDQLFGGSGDDVLKGGTGADTLNGGSGMDYADYSDSTSGVTVNLATGAASGGEAAGDVLSGIDGFYGSIHADTFIGFDGQGTSGDVYTNIFYGGGGNDYLDGAGANDTLFGGTGNDTVLGGTGEDSLAGDEGADSLYGGSGNDVLDGGADADLVMGGDGNDQVSGGAGDDLVHGDGGNDTLNGNDGNDILYGGDGADILIGGDGDDTLIGGAGADTLTGGAGRDTFVIGLGDTINGSEEGDDQDTLDLTGMGPLRIFRDTANPENGYVQLYDANGNPTGQIYFTNIETIIPCFTPGAMIDTRRGPVPVEEIRVGDRVLTRDNGFRTVRWTGSRTLGSRVLAQAPHLLPVVVPKDAFGPGQPERDLLVSRQHRMLMGGRVAELAFGEAEVLACAGHLIGRRGIRVAPVTEATYLHLLFDGHEVIRANGCWTESFQPGQQVAGAMDAAVRDEIIEIFPELAQGRQVAFAAARPTLRAWEAGLLVA